MPAPLPPWMKTGIAAALAVAILGLVAVGLLSFDSEPGTRDYHDHAGEFIPDDVDGSAVEEGVLADSLALAYANPRWGIDEVESAQVTDAAGTVVTLLALTGSENSMNMAEWLVTDRSGEGWPDRGFSGNVHVDHVVDIATTTKRIDGTRVTVVDTLYKNKPVGQTTAYARPTDNSMVVAVAPPDAAGSAESALEAMLDVGTVA